MPMMVTMFQIPTSCEFPKLKDSGVETRSIFNSDKRVLFYFNVLFDVM